MRRCAAILLAAAAAAALAGCSGPRSAGGPGRAHLALSADDRVLVLAPHPDDEVLGAAGVIQRCVELGLPVRVAFLTSGDFNEWSFTLHRRRPALSPEAVRRTAAVRQREALAAAAELGLEEHQVVFLGYPDAGTMTIWSRHWGDRPAYLSRLTRVRRVPYEEAQSTAAPYLGDAILADLHRLLDEHRPTRVFLSHPADSHPDHQALYLFTRVALWQRGEDRPRLHPYLVHYPGWPGGRGLRPWSRLAPPPDLEEVSWQSFPLWIEEIDDKLSALRRHATQYRTGRSFLRRFVRANELFGDFPLLVLPTGASRELAHEGEPTPIPEWLDEEERRSYVVPRHAELRRVEGALEVEVELNRPLGRQVLQVGLFGFRPDVDFAAMPKLRVRVAARGHAVYDQATRLPPDSVTVAGGPRVWTVRVPLERLGHPDRLLIGGRIALAGWPRAWLPWRTVALPPERGRW